MAIGEADFVGSFIGACTFFQRLNSSLLHVDEFASGGDELENKSAVLSSRLAEFEYPRVLTSITRLVA